MKSFPFWFVLFVAPLFLSACGGNFLVGKWVLDRETTVSHFGTSGGKEEAAPGGGFLKEVFSGIQKGASHLLMAQFEGVEIEFTATEMRRIRGGTGEVTKYKVIEQPERHQLVLHYANDEIYTWERVETGIRMRLPGKEALWIYFKRSK